LLAAQRFCHFGGDFDRPISSDALRPLAEREFPFRSITTWRTVILFAAASISCHRNPNASDRSQAGADNQQREIDHWRIMFGEVVQ